MVLRGLRGTRWLVLMALALGACTTDDPTPPQIHIIGDTSVTNAIDISNVEINGDDRGDDLCTMAAALPASDVCSLVCDPDQFADFLLAEGMHTGTCYHFRCTLSATTTVSVGVCLP